VRKRSIDRTLAVIGTLREPTRRRLYEYVERQPRAVSRDEASQALGISRALAAFHLEKLVQVGILKPQYRRLSGRTGPGAGRTSKLYRRSHEQVEMSLPHRDHELLARLFADALASRTPAHADGGPAHDYGRSLGVRARRRLRGRPTDDRLSGCVEAVLETLGFDPYRAGTDEIRLRNCPFDPLSRLYSPVVCGAAQALLRGVVEGVGSSRLQVGREESGDRCCGVLGPNPPMEKPGAFKGRSGLQGVR
jgi:predicted ArsR family transcriptional regulator